jgi:hypothetical protein
MINKNTLRQKKWKVIAKILLNLSILFLIFLLLMKRRERFDPSFNIQFFLLLPYEYLILFLISLRIFSLAHLRGYNLSMKDIYLITITIKFYQILFPSLLAEGVRGIKYFFAGLRDKYDILFLLVFDRIIGFTTFFLLFLASAITLKTFHIDKTMFLLLLLFSFAFVLVLLNIERIKRAVAHAFDDHIPKKALILPLILSLVAQMSIMLKYFFIFYWIVGINMDFLKTLYLCSASHLSQIVPISTGLFSIKDGFLFFILHTEKGQSLKALHLLFVLGSVEFFNGLGGGIIESLNLTAKTIPRRKDGK